MIKRLLVCFALLAGCSQATEGPVDDFATVPAPPTADTVVYTLPEQVIPPGRDVLLCHYLDMADEDIYVRAFESYQGKSGHHLVLFYAIITAEPGSVSDCSTAEDMIKFRPIVSNRRFGIDSFPDGMAVRIPRGTQLVLQQHYVNATEHELRVRDVAHLIPAKVEDVHTLVGFFGLSTLDFTLAPTNVEEEIRFDCRVPFDTNLLTIGPHMHEWGRRFKVEVERDGVSESLIDIPAWTGAMRDEPPITVYGVEGGKALRAGDVLRTTCTFRNDRGRALQFPEEMCATFGYFFPATRGNDQFLCGGTTL